MNWKVEKGMILYQFQRGEESNIGIKEEKQQRISYWDQREYGDNPSLCEGDTKVGEIKG